jgi:hypothetical protein
VRVVCIVCCKLVETFGWGDGSLRLDSIHLLRRLKHSKYCRTPLIRTLASHKSNLSSIPQGYLDSYSTIGHVGGGDRCGGDNLMRVTTTHAG